MRSIFIYLLSVIIVSSTVLTQQSCKKFVEVDAPITSTNSDLVFRNDASAIAAVNNIYATMSNSGIYSGITSMSLFPSLSSDELVLFDHVTDQGAIAYSKNQLVSSDVNTGNYWISTYSSYLFYINSAIEQLTNNVTLTVKVRDQLLGESKFLRAFCYFYLVNLYDGVPLVLTTDYRNNSQIPRASSDEVYSQIISDLSNAVDLLNENYLDGTLINITSERIAPNKSTARALLARVYLYRKNWKGAEAEASKVISNTSQYDTVPLAAVYLKNSKEVIWQLQSVSNSLSNTSDARLFLNPKTFLLGSKYYLSPNLIDAFELGDKRRTAWIDSVVDNSRIYYLPAKYKIYDSQVPETERTVIMRLAELFLIRAEVRVELGDVEGALADINTIRARAGLQPVVFTSKEDFLRSILHERRIELFTEWGHRWLDLKREGVIDQVLGPLKGATWQNTDKLYPIPMSEMLINHALQNNQNPGY